jgi:hypothetical protein
MTLKLMPVRSRLTIAMLGISAAVGFGGCGSGDETAAPVRPYADANRICLEVAKRFDDVQQDSPRSFEQGEQLLKVLAQTADDGARALDQVEAPPLQALAFDRYLQSRKRVEDLIARGVKAAQDEEGEAYERLRVTANHGADERKELAAEAGLDGCATAERG